MPRKLKKKKKSSFRLQSGFVTLLLVVLIVALGLAFSGVLMGEDTLRGTRGKNVGPALTSEPNQTSDNLQLQTLAFGRECDFDSEADGCTCPSTQQYGPYHTDQPEQECYFVAPDKVNDECTLLKLCEQNVGACSWTSPGGCIIPRSITGNFVEPGVGDNPNNIPNLGCAKWKQDLSNGKHWCVGKPVIYLYPEKPTYVDVVLDIPGEIYISIPEYPLSKGWKAVYAEPDGTLTYNGKKYMELYYETKVSINKIPKTGIIIPFSNIKSELYTLTRQLGLKHSEQQEFLEYWLPLLAELKKPYILFSVLDQDEKERIDGVSINPTPDVFINFIAYFKGLDKPVEIDPLSIPTPPLRTGFTAVEWGGTIDY